VEMQFLGFQKFGCFANKAHCCATFMVIEFATIVVLVIAIKIDVKSQ
jgi:hypothetical protein